MTVVNNGGVREKVTKKERGTVNYRFLVLSFVFKASQKIASFTLGLKSFVKIWEGDYRARGAWHMYDSFSNKHET